MIESPEAGEGKPKKMKGELLPIGSEIPYQQSRASQLASWAKGSPDF